MIKSKYIIPIIIYYSIYAFIYAGWIFHKSLKPMIFNYSASYFLFLVVMAIPFLLPVIVRIYVKYLGWPGLWYSVCIGSFLLFSIYFIASQWYYYHQRHPFDPFLQNAPKRLKNGLTDKRRDEFRILCLGGSTTEGLALPKEERYPKVLESTLRKDYGAKNIEVFNAGKNWYTTKHSLISFITYYSDWKPDLVIVMHAINDLCRSFSPPDYSIGEYNDLWSHFYGPAMNGARPPTFEQYILSYFDVPLSAWYAKFRFKEADYQLERYRSIKVFESNLRKMIKYVKINNSDIILVSQPSLYKDEMSSEELERLYFGKTIANERLNFIQRSFPSHKSFYSAMKLFNEAVKDASINEDAIFVDAADRIEKNLENFEDDAHYTAKGARKLAEMIAETIRKKRLIEKRLYNEKK